jgi:hypothetical protein
MRGAVFVGMRAFVGLIADFPNSPFSGINYVLGNIFYLAQEAFAFAFGFVRMAFRPQLVVAGGASNGLFGLAAYFVNFTFYFIAHSFAHFELLSRIY